MKPGDHPDFFRRPPPAGRSRESTIVLSKEGRFSHDGEPVEHRGLANGFASWLSTHPDDGRFILTNGYDWCYLTVEGTPFFVRSVSRQHDALVAELFDGTQEPLDLATLAVDEDGVFTVHVKDGRYTARFTREAQLMMAPFLTGDPLAVELNGERYPIELTLPSR